VEYLRRRVVVSGMHESLGTDFRDFRGQAIKYINACCNALNSARNVSIFDNQSPKFMMLKSWLLEMESTLWIKIWAGPKKRNVLYFSGKVNREVS